MSALAKLVIALVALAVIGRIHVSLWPGWVVQFPVVLLTAEALAVAGMAAAIVLVVRAPRGWPGPAVTP